MQVDAYIYIHACICRRSVLLSLPAVPNMGANEAAYSDMPRPQLVKRLLDQDAEVRSKERFVVLVRTQVPRISMLWALVDPLPKLSHGAPERVTHAGHRHYERWGGGGPDLTAGRRAAQRASCCKAARSIRGQQPARRAPQQSSGRPAAGHSTEGYGAARCVAGCMARNECCWRSTHLHVSCRRACVGAAVGARPH